MEIVDEHKREKRERKIFLEEVGEKR